MPNPPRPRNVFQLSKGCILFLNITMFITFICAVTQISTTVMVSWRVANPIKYTFIYRNSRKIYSFGETRYGLYKVHFDDDGIIETWTQRVENMKEKGSLAIQQGLANQSSGSLSMWTSVCPENCRAAINTRISGYERISFVSLIFLCSIVISSAIVLLSLGWNILFSKSTFILMGSLVLAVVINGGAGGYWYYETDLTWNTIFKAQQFPFPKCSYCFYIFIITSMAYVICFFFCLIIDIISKAQQKNLKMNRYNKLNKNMVNSPVMYQPMMFNNPNNIMSQRSASYANNMHYEGYPNLMQPHLGYTDPTNYEDSYFKNMKKNFSYSNTPTQYNPNMSYNMYDQNFQNMPNYNDLYTARQYSGMNYTNPPFMPNNYYPF